MESTKVVYKLIDFTRFYGRTLCILYKGTGKLPSIWIRSYPCLSLSLLIREHYRFACGCAACEADYPSLAAGLASKPLIMVRGMDGERGKVEELGETNFFLALKERNPAFLILNQCCDR